MFSLTRRFDCGMVSVALASALFVAVTPPPATASVLTLAPLADANSNGHDAGAYGLQLTGGNVPILDYDLSGLPAGATIDSATLSFEVYGFDPSGVTMLVTAFPKSDSTIDSGDASASGRGVFGFDAITFDVQTINLNVDSLVP